MDVRNLEGLAGLVYIPEFTSVRPRCRTHWWVCCFCPVPEDQEPGGPGKHQGVRCIGQTGAELEWQVGAMRTVTTGRAALALANDLTSLVSAYILSVVQFLSLCASCWPTPAFLDPLSVFPQLRQILIQRVKEISASSKF